YEFLGAAIHSLARAQNGISIVQAAAGSTNLVDLMTANRNGTVEIDMAESELRPFAAALDTNRRHAANAFIDSYGAIKQSLAIQLSAYNQMDSAQTAQDLAGIRGRISAAKFAYQQGSAILGKAALMAFMSTMVPLGDNGGHVTLGVSDAERIALASKVDSLF